MHLSCNTHKRINYYASSWKKSVLICGWALSKHFKSTLLRCKRFQIKISNKMANVKIEGTENLFVRTNLWVFL